MACPVSFALGIGNERNTAASTTGTGVSVSRLNAKRRGLLSQPRRRHHNYLSPLSLRYLMIADGVMIAVSRFEPV
jgi:hypothetical protein